VSPFLARRTTIRRTRLRGVLLDMLNGFQNVLKTGAIVPHSTTASARTLSRTRTRNPLSVTTSTGPPRASWRSISRPPRSEIVRPDSRSTRKSTSLCASLCPRATEPNTRTLYAPCLAASPRTESRRVARSSCKVIPYPFSHFSWRREMGSWKRIPGPQWCAVNPSDTQIASGLAR